MHVRSRSIVVLLAALGVGMPLQGQSPEDEGLRVMREVDARARGFGDLVAVLRMTIHDQGEPRVRVLHVSLLEASDGDRTLAVLREPVDLSGTSFLSVRSGAGDRAQWIYLPSRRRARRISGAQSSDPFLGSHFTYGDLDPPTLAGYRFRIAREETWEGGAGVVVERRLESAADGRHELLWVDTEEYRVDRVEYVDENGQTERALVIGGYEIVDGFSRATRLEMQDAGSNGRTTLEWSELRIGVGLSERDFDPRRLGG